MTSKKRRSFTAEFHGGVQVGSGSAGDGEALQRSGGFLQVGRTGRPSLGTTLPAQARLAMQRLIH